MFQEFADDIKSLSSDNMVKLLDLAIYNLHPTEASTVFDFIDGDLQERVDEKSFDYKSIINILKLLSEHNMVC